MLEFGSFTISPDRASLYRGSSKVRLGSRAFQILVALVERQGQVVTSQELMAVVWDGVFVEESNLRVNICALRKALSDGEGQQRFIHNVPGRGYRFVGATQLSPVALFGPERGPPSSPAEPLIGRADFIRRAGCETETKRLVTLVGTGGIGKTSIAQVVSARWIERSAVEPIFVDLASVSSASAVPEVAAAAAGVAGIFEDMTAALIRHLKDRHTLLVLDNCEHVIEAAANLADALQAGTSGIHILATSREPLRSRGEQVLRVPALDFPGNVEGLRLEDANAYPAVRMFAAAANAADDMFVLTAANCSHVGAICRRLDGIPLAIELAAAQVGTLGVERLSAELETKLDLPKRARRSGTPRHRTLHAALAWSHDLLSPMAKEVLESFACFAAKFDLAGATAVTSGLGLSEGETLNLICDLVDKSLLTVEASGNAISYRLLETTRAFLLERSESGGRGAAVRLAHASFLLGRLVSLRAEMSQEAIRSAADYMLDVRRALDWCFADQRAVEVGARLTAVATTFWMKLLLMRENHQFMLLAKEAVDHDGGLELPLGDEISLHLTLALTWYYRTGAGPEVEEALRRALELARSNNSVPPEIKAVWLSYAFLGNDGSYAAELELAERYRELTRNSNDSFTEFVFYRMRGRACHDLGRHAEAEHFLRRALAAARNVSTRLTPYDVEIDMWSAAKGTLARTLWLRGHPDQARQMAAESLREAVALDHSASICWTLVFNVIPVNFWCGDTDLVSANIRLLLAQSRLIAEPWHLAGELYHDALHALRSKGKFLIDRTRVRTRRGQFDIFATLPVALPGDIVRTLDASEPNWATPEILRRKADTLLKTDKGVAAEAGQLLDRARAMASEQGASAWELRIATTELERCRRTDHEHWARRELERVLAGYVEGIDTIDVQRAHRMLLDHS